jgi:hypothetical protein
VPPYIRFHRSRLLRAAALAAGAFIACKSPVEPLQPGDRVTVGPLYENAISGGVDRNYSFETVVNGEYVVFLKSFTGLRDTGG